MDIGISDSLWKLIQDCWNGKIEQRPQIQEVVKEVGHAADNWHTNMPPSGAEQSEDSLIDEQSDELKHGGFLSFFLFGTNCAQFDLQLVYSNPIEARTHHFPARAPLLCVTTIRPPSGPNELWWRPLTSIMSSCTNI